MSFDHLEGGGHILKMPSVSEGCGAARLGEKPGRRGPCRDAGDRAEAPLIPWENNISLLSLPLGCSQDASALLSKSIEGEQAHRTRAALQLPSLSSAKTCCLMAGIFAFNHRP